MSAPAFVRCVCGHNPQRHEVPGFDGECVAEGCSCRAWRPATPAPVAAPAALKAVTPAPPPAAVPPRPVAPVAMSTGPSLEQLIAAGKRSTRKRTLALATKVETLAGELMASIRDERAQAEQKRAADEQRAAAQREIAELERRLTEAKARARGQNPPLKPALPPGAGQGGSFPCTAVDCGRHFDTRQGLQVHRGRAHSQAG